LGGLRAFPIWAACDALGSIAVVDGLKPRHPPPRLFERCRWQLKG
jgi:hypothetical protein